MYDTTSRYRVARLCVFPPHSVPEGAGRWALTASLIRKGVPTAQILGDGVLPAMSSRPTTEEVIMAMDAALSSMRLS